MFITRTPLRISFFGGGTDYPEHYRKSGGQTLGVAINQYSFIVVKRLADLFDHRIRVGGRVGEEERADVGQADRVVGRDEDVLSVQRSVNDALQMKRLDR